VDAAPEARHLVAHYGSAGFCVQDKMLVPEAQLPSIVRVQVPSPRDLEWFCVVLPQHFHAGLSHDVAPRLAFAFVPRRCSMSIP
jgi:hypothetical protein